ncbi:uncharacterized protein LOC130736038 [Lotus japonicus]|uniref:uncharacterized protein LOC130736038 n=1 Tax=Lotus japonicus TaxID=34305 RepID=UPI002587A39C|nr:uncharacterized protein LOC130736038 [Lotus japonicus]
MDKQKRRWIKLKDRTLPEYLKGVEDFLDFAFSGLKPKRFLRCPCRKCNNVRYKSRDDVMHDLLKWGFEPSYERWEYHGERVSDSSSDNDSHSEDEDNDYDVNLQGNDDAQTYSMLHDMDRGNVFDYPESSNMNEEPNKEAKSLYGLLKDAEQKLYPGCQKFSKLSFIMRLFQMKCVYGWSNNSFDSLIKLLVEALPEGNVLPNSMYEVRKIIKDLGLDYVKIDACVNDCILFRGGEYENLDKCPICGESRWQENKKKNVVPNKVVRYFPIKPRLQRLFMSKQIADDMKWHKHKRIDDGVMRHPADSLTWKRFDDDHEDFSSDPRNVRLGLASDGFNPFGIMSTAYSVWPVVLIPYNLPPWLCMKQPNIILTLLISGPKSPGIDIDVYLQPLIDDLKELWDAGIETYDASSRQNFQLRAALLWTINDFPAYAMLSGWSTKGKLACPCCHSETSSCRLKYGRKQCYMGHRRFLPTQHPWRMKKSPFDNTREVRVAPEPLTGDQVIAQLEGLELLPFGKATRKRKRIAKVNHNWKKKSIFFELPYWRTNLLRHNIDVMHVDKNICESVIGTLLDLEGKTKDTINSRLDLQRMGLKKQLHPIKIEDKYVIPPARYTMSKTEKTNFCRILKDVKFPDAYASNIGRCVNINELKISGLKSHDYHVILERLLPLAIRGLLPKDACDPLIEMSLFFGDLCSKELKLDELDHLQNRIGLTLCKLERIFPPSFFDVMVHLSVHLANEAKIGGPVQYRWMYPVERFLRILKSYVRNKARPEGSIAEGYVAEECMTFCARYLTDMDSRLNRPDRYMDYASDEFVGLSVFKNNGRSIGGGSWESMSSSDIQQAHFYILQNCEEVRPWIEEHMTKIRNESERNVAKRHREQFHKWFENEVVRLQQLGDTRITNQLVTLSKGPDFRVFNHKGYILNGFKFRTKDAEKHLKTQNSGVIVKGDELTGHADYYGVVRKITEIKYLDNKFVILFKCDWFEAPSEGRNQGRGYKKDDYGFISVDITRLFYKNDPFILGSQAELVYYVQYSDKENWYSVVKVKPRHIFDLPNGEDDDEFEAYQLNELSDTHGELATPLENQDEDALLGEQETPLVDQV